MKNVFLYLFLLTNVCSYSQTKGVTNLSTNNQQLATNTYAVVIGVSDYQDPDIPDLRYADKDAEAFANYLKSQAGGQLNAQQIKLLLNEKATMAQFAIQLDWLMEQAKEGDLVYIYFSGHGDVEKRTLTQPGFLLCWDAPAQVYMSGGAFALPMLQEVISTLSLQNKAKVIVITDACRSGKLSGSSINGNQLTNANLAKQYANEIKILSCQPNEYSIEGEQWGGGRGAFSYNLINALYGLADQNQDKIVSLHEVGRYLEDHVATQVAPVSQIPMVLGNRNEQLARINEQLLAEIDAGRITQATLLSTIETRGFEETILLQVDSSIQRTYKLFNLAIKEKRFLEPIENCAEKYYALLSVESKLSALHSTLRRNYAAALQDEAQQVINKYMKSDIYEVSISFMARIRKYESYAVALARAAELLGPQHYLYKALQARKSFFEGFKYSFKGDFITESVHKGLKHFREALSWQSDLPIVHFGMQNIFGYLTTHIDSAEYYAIKANELAPNWILPYVRLSQMFSTNFNNYEKSFEYLSKVNEMDANNPLVWEAEANYYFDRRLFTEAKISLEKILANKHYSTCLPCAKSLLVQTYIELGQYNTAESLANELYAEDSTNYTTRIDLGKIYTLTNRFEMAKAEFQAVARLAALKYNPESLYAYWLAYIHAQRNEFDEAFKAFEFSIKTGYDDYMWMQVDPDYQLLRNHKIQWNALMKKHFPKLHKD